MMTPMVTVVGIRFKRAGKIYYFDPGALRPTLSETVVVETPEGPELGEVAVRVKEVPQEDVVQPLRRLLRIATQEDRSRVARFKDEEREAFDYCRAKIAELQLEMKLVDAEFALDRQRLTFYFTAERRVDFRELVRDLAARFRTRIELRQIGARDEAKLLDGVGVCGRSLCCSTWMTDFEPVSIRHAKLQELSLNPSRISGLCGRLKCCLRYEEDVYESLRKAMPKVGDNLATNRGPAKVVEVQLLKERIVVQTVDGSRFTIPLQQLQASEAAAVEAARAKPLGAARAAAGPEPEGADFAADFAEADEPLDATEAAPPSSTRGKAQPASEAGERPGPLRKAGGKEVRKSGGKRALAPEAKAPEGSARPAYAERSPEGPEAKARRHRHRHRRRRPPEAANGVSDHGG